MENSIHARIKQRRIELGLSMQVLAEMVGASSWQTVQQWEKEGGTAPKRDRMTAVAKALQTSPEWLSHGITPDQIRDAEAEMSAQVEPGSAADDITQTELLAAFNALQLPAQKQAIIALLRAFGALR